MFCMVILNVSEVMIILTFRAVLCVRFLFPPFYILFSSFFSLFSSVCLSMLSVQVYVCLQRRRRASIVGSGSKTGTVCSLFVFFFFSNPLFCLDCDFAGMPDWKKLMHFFIHFYDLIILI